MKYEFATLLDGSGQLGVATAAYQNVSLRVELLTRVFCRQKAEAGPAFFLHCTVGFRFVLRFCCFCGLACFGFLYVFWGWVFSLFSPFVCFSSRRGSSRSLKRRRCYATAPLSLRPGAAILNAGGRRRGGGQSGASLVRHAAAAPTARGPARGAGAAGAAGAAVMRRSAVPGRNG